MTDASTLAAVAIDGVGTGLLLALLGVGITLVFGLGEILNLAQGVFAVLAALFTLEAIDAGAPVPLAIAVGLVGLGVVAVLVDGLLLGRIYDAEPDERILVGIFVTLGLTLAIQGLLYNVQSYRFSLPMKVQSVRALGIVIRGPSLLNIVVSGLVIGALFLFLRRTFLGKAARTITQDEFGAHLCGVDTRRVRLLIFVTSAVIAGVAGLLQGVGGSLSAASGFELTVQALIVAIVGGVRNVPGTVVAGVGLGLVLAFANFYIGSYLALIAMFGAAMLAIAARRGAFA